MTTTTPDTVSEADFRALFALLQTESHQPVGDRRGALNNLTPRHTRAAMAEVRSGETVSLAFPIETEPRVDNPSPIEHKMTCATGDEIDGKGLEFATDRLSLNVHGNGDTHMDALCHVVFDGRLYNDVPAGAVTAAGAVELSIDVAHDGVVGRGVLLDIPRLRGVRWLEPGDAVSYDELLAAEQAQGVTVGAGDVLVVRLGHHYRRRELGPWDVASTRAGLHPEAMRFAAERQIALLGCDSNSDVAPSVTTVVDFPVHVLAINAMGLQLIDYLSLDDLAAHCERRKAWSFLCVVAPLRMPTATGSLVNPIAVL